MNKKKNKIYNNRIDKIIIIKEYLYHLLLKEWLENMIMILIKLMDQDQMVE